MLLFMASLEATRASFVWDCVCCSCLMAKRETRRGVFSSSSSALKEKHREKCNLSETCSKPLSRWGDDSNLGFYSSFKSKIVVWKTRIGGSLQVPAFIFGQKNHNHNADIQENRFILQK